MILQRLNGNHFCWTSEKKSETRQSHIPVDSSSHKCFARSANHFSQSRGCTFGLLGQCTPLPEKNITNILIFIIRINRNSFCKKRYGFKQELFTSHIEMLSYFYLPLSLYSHHKIYLRFCFVALNFSHYVIMCLCKVIFYVLHKLLILYPDFLEGKIVRINTALIHSQFFRFL